MQEKVRPCSDIHVLRVDLASGKSRVEDLSDQFHLYLGGSGLAAKILFDELPQWVTPYDPANKIIIAAGALMGTPTPGACKISVSTIGPMTGGWATGSSDSHFGRELRQAGYDMVILENRCLRPSYLYISNDTVELRDASDLWGRDTWETVDLLSQQLGNPDLHCIAIGQAGENLVRGACLIQDKHRAFGRCGTGAVFGSKQMKAIVCQGTSSISVADPPLFLQRVTACRSRILNSGTTKSMGKVGTLGSLRHRQKVGAVAYRNFQGYTLPEGMVDDIDPAPIIDHYEEARCGFPGCPICCGRTVRITEGEFSGPTSAMNPYEILGGVMSKLDVRKRDFQVEVYNLCNRYGLDVDMLGGVLAWAMECYQRGILTEEQTGGLAIPWGDTDVIMKLIDMIVFREGFGAVLSEGCKRAADIVGNGSEYYAMHIKGQDLYEMMRASNGLCLGTAVSTRGGTHTTGAPCIEQSSAPLDDETAMRIFGISADQVMNPDRYDGKPEMILYYEVLARACNSLGICIFNTVWLDTTHMTVEDIADVLSAAAGRTYTAYDLKEIALRCIDVEKAINLKFTDFDRKDDMPTQRDLLEPVPDGPRKGWRLDRGEYDKMLDRYYELHGWDKRTSYPTRSTLERRGLADVADALAVMKKLGDN